MEIEASVGDRARLRLMTAAERLFAARGINGVSAREIAAAAGQRNTNAVKYHFGSVQSLVEALFEHRMREVNARRIELIAVYDGEGRSADPRAVAEAFARPLVELMDRLRAGEDGGSWYLRFCVQAAYTVHPEVTTLGPDDLGRTPWTTGLKALTERAVEVAGGVVPARIAHRRWEQFTGFATHELAGREQRLELDPTHTPDPSALFLADLVDAGAGLLMAPAHPSTLALAPEAAPSA
ncbi:TetR/AcrR family transcriptional regulator [Yinghuangia seranimata]|uniref:TetR/AcrR family transcriptional regulator n=1 Tax=Yinghuangia seranimata TaxID=408067 RepID=UPI00248BEFB3|nr:helix-turn-helix domain-containing protein [Yinghuangia seranimata]MDI2128437.1 helix-turn-helix domain-containing protein [Yinghuangia seranimata]